MLTIFTIALVEPTATGVCIITKDRVALAANVPSGLVVTLYCEALAPVKTIELIDKVPVPEF